MHNKAVEIVNKHIAASGSGSVSFIQPLNEALPY